MLNIETFGMILNIYDVLVRRMFFTFILACCSNLQEWSLASHHGGLALVMWDFVMDKSGAGAGFLRELRFPLPIYIPSASPQPSPLSPEADMIGQEWPQCQ
jgi:hypothetical protein